MKVTFFGGGGFRTLPLVRSAMAEKKILDGGEVFLYDLDGLRAEAMGRMILKTPEYAGIQCKVKWGTSLDKALDGADAVHVAMMAGSPLAFSLSSHACEKYGFIGSDQMSPSGAFLALKGGPIVLKCAQRMEKLCPDATLIIFANPVAVLSGTVNLFTKIRALGICGGQESAGWDLSRLLLGRDQYCDDFDLDVAGINHLSFIVRGTYHGKDLYELLGKHLTADWKVPHIMASWGEAGRTNMRFAIRKLADMYHRFGSIIFSTEFDGMMHLFYEEMVEERFKSSKRVSRASLEAGVRRGIKAREAADRAFRDLLNESLDAKYWAKQPRADFNVVLRILRGLAGVRREKIVSSHLNKGAIKGFKDDTVVEYSQYLDTKRLVPSKDLEVPDVFHGLISSLATHQTLLAKAIGTTDPHLLYKALFAYPIKQNTQASRALIKELLEINKDDIPGRFQTVRKYV